MQHYTFDSCALIAFFTNESGVLATARVYKSTIVTSDHHEFNVIEEKGDALFEWIR